MRSGDPAAEAGAAPRRRSRRPCTLAAKLASLRTSSTPSSGTSDSTATQRDDGRDQARLAEGADQVGARRTCSAMNEMPAVPWVSTQAGPTTSMALRNAWYLSFAGDQPVARREGELHAVGEADHHDQRRHHVEEHVEAEIEPAERAERQQDRDQRRRRRDDHERHAAEEQDRDQAAGDEADGVVEQPVALDGVADLELHDRHAGELRRSGRCRRDRPPWSCGFRRRWSLSPLPLDDRRDRARARPAPACRPPTAACRG